MERLGMKLGAENCRSEEEGAAGKGWGGKSAESCSCVLSQHAVLSLSRPKAKNEASPIFSQAAEMLLSPAPGGWR